MKQCPKCNHKNENDSEFCENCGQSLLHVQVHDDLMDTEHDILGTVIDKAGNILEDLTKRIQDNIYDKKVASRSTITTQHVESNQHSEQFIDSDETTQATLGVSTIQNFMSGAGFKSGAAILTDKRLYYFGRCFSRRGIGANWSTEEVIIPVDEISSTRFIHRNPISFLIVGILLLLASLSMLMEGSNAISGIGMGVMVICIMSFLAYFFNRNTVFEIAFPGGKCRFDLRFHSASNMREFQRQVHTVKDHLQELKIAKKKDKMEALQ